MIAVTAVMRRNANPENVLKTSSGALTVGVFDRFGGAMVSSIAKTRATKLIATSPAIRKSSGAKIATSAFSMSGNATVSAHWTLLSRIKWADILIFILSISLNNTGDADCPDSSDEKTCGHTCMPSEFLCDNNQCISALWRCDGEDDCGDNSDEELHRCSTIACPPGRFRCKNNICISNEKVNTRIVPLWKFASLKPWSI